MEPTDLAIIGAGWFGLVMAKTYLQIHPAGRIIVFDDAKSIGGTWAKERLYPDLRTNNLASGYFQYSDFPMDGERFGLKPDEHIPGSVVHEYLLQYAKEFGIYSSIRFGSKVETAEMKEDGSWCLTISELATSRQYILHAKKLVLATGLMSDPFVPQFDGGDQFKVPILHLKELGQHIQATSFESIKRVVVIGASKSAWDVCYLYASRGVRVEWVIRSSGFGPVWMATPRITPLKLYLEQLLWTRAVTWFSPSIWGVADGWVKKFLHGTWLGRKIVFGFWSILGNDMVTLSRYDEHAETKKLKSWNHPFWGISSTSILNYDTDFMELVRNGTIKVHIADITHLSGENKVHLSNGNNISADALICTTGWKFRPAVEMLPIDLPLGLPSNSPGPNELIAKADKVILDQLPVLRTRPYRNPNYVPMKSSGYEDAQPTQPYRLYRFLVPPSQVLTDRRTIALLGAHHVISKIPVAQLQALWLTAYFDDKISNLKPERTSQEEIEWQTILHTQFGKWRYPAIANGKGERYPEMALEGLPYVDMLLTDLGMNIWRKKSWWKNYVLPYTLDDYKGLVEEWLEIQAKAAHGSISSEEKKTI
jgi:cation diffusion facilitator CzcD-associated flavoprotein CzcO